MSASAFKTEYESVCNAEQLRPRKEVLAACDAAAGIEAGAELRVNGNAPALRDDRLLDVDVQLLATSLAKGGHPFAALDASYNRLGGECADALKELLRTDSRLQALDLSYSDLGGAAAEKLCEGLRENQALRELRLSGNALGASGGMAVAEMLQVNDSIQRVYLGACELTSETLVALATVLRHNASVALLDVQRPLINSLGEEAIAHFSQMLAVNRTLVELDLSKSGMRDHGLKLIAAELRHAPASALKALRLRCNQVELKEPSCVDEVAGLFGSEGCALAVLDLSANRLRDEGALIFAEILQRNASLVSLDLTYNAIGTSGLCMLGHVCASHDGGLLHEVRLSGNRFDSAACRAWLPSLSAGMALDFTVQEVDGLFHAAGL